MTITTNSKVYVCKMVLWDILHLFDCKLSISSGRKCTCQRINTWKYYIHCFSWTRSCYKSNPHLKTAHGVFGKHITYWTIQLCLYSPRTVIFFVFFFFFVLILSIGPHFYSSYFWFCPLIKKIQKEVKTKLTITI